MKIYTRTGDGGDTGLFGGGRTSKDDVRVEAYGSLDELNAVIGLVISVEPKDFESRLLQSIQEDLFAIGGQLASPEPDKVANALEKAQLSDTRVGELEAEIDRVEAELKPLRSFILPGGTTKAAAFHLARAVCRRAERQVVTLHQQTRIPPVVIPYLNRLSDLLFQLARLCNAESETPDRTW